ncbi:MAG: PQQ-binding-like beta-propeller repeat protein [Pirellulaceae bacterium]|nr:PQQ-binding-like beta-propeller repeat protein [Pirellulaceae bacterium]
MMKRISGWLLAVVLCLPVAHAAAEDTGEAGLNMLWQSQVRVDGSRDTVSEIVLQVHDDRAVSYYEILGPGLREVVGLDDLNPRGVAFRDVYPEDPTQGAREWAEMKAEIFKAEGFKDLSVTLVTVPQTTLYAITGEGGVHAIDAETGQTRWVTRVGPSSAPTVGLAANNTRVLAVRGSKVYCLDSSNGEEIWSRYCYYAPGGGVAMSDDFAYVTSVEGRLQMFPLNDTGLPEAYFASSGAATFDPEVTATTVSWATERGYFNVALSTETSLQYRLETDDVFEAPGTAVGGMLVANSLNGKVYAVDEDMGTVEWEFAVGEPLAKKPVALGTDVVMLITLRDNLIPLNAKTGKILEGWPKRISGITEYVGASQNILYFLDNAGNLVGLNRKSGAAISRQAIGFNAIPIANHFTDRLYIAQPNGAVFSLREVANINPVVIGEEFVVGDAAGKAEADKKKPPTTTTDPFAGGQAADPNDPFSNPVGKGDDKKSTADPDDPFSGSGGVSSDDDPFGGGSDKSSDKKEDDDPFGGGSDKSSDKSSDKEEDDDPFGGGN